MVKQQESFEGNLLFYDYVLTKRQPVFLQRNLEVALHAHQQELETGDWLLPPPPAAIDRSLWRPPSRDSFNAIMRTRKEQEAFVVEVIGIEPLKLDRSPVSRPPRKKAPFFITHVDVDISLLDPISGFASHTSTKTNVKMAGVNSEKGKVISLDMSDVDISLDKIVRPTPGTRSNGPIGSKVGPKPWNLRITIKFQNAKDAKDFHSQMSPTSSSGQGDSPMHLVMQRNNILQCPPKPEVYPFTAVGGKKLNMGLKVSMYWRASRDESILATHNRRLRSSSAASHRMMPPPDLPRPTQYELIYILSGKTIRKRRLFCPHQPCMHRDFRDIDHLRKHLDSMHDLFRYQCIKSSTSDGVETWQFTSEVSDYHADYKRASNAAPDPREIQLLAPSVPFNQKKYLDEGNDDFQKEARLEIASRPVTRSTRSARSNRNIPLDSYLNDSGSVLVAKGKKKTYRVPKAPPGVTFFRAVTKRPLQEGEWVSESDDEVDTEWVRHRRNVQNDADTSIPESAKRFLKLFDPFIRDERLHSDQRLGTSMVRFARTRAEALWRDDIADEFKVKLDELLEDGMIPFEAHEACLDIVEKHRPSRHSTLPKRLASLAVIDHDDDERRSQSPRTRSRAASVRNATRKSQSRQPTPVSTPDLEGDVEMSDPKPFEEDGPAGGRLKDDSNIQDDVSPPYDLCLCGEDALTASNRPFVVCESIDCIRHAYHVACIERYWPDVEPPERLSRNAKFICRECHASPLHSDLA